MRFGQLGWVALVAAGCSADFTLGGGYSDGDDADGASDTGGGGGAGGGPGGGGGGSLDTGLPSEDEGDRLQLRPAQTDVFVFVANPDRDTVTRVNVRTREVRTADVGHTPRAVATTPDYATAVVFNAGDDTVSLIDAATLEVEVVPVRDNLNAMVLSPDGRHAILWHSVAAEEDGDRPPGGAASYNEVSLVDVVGRTHTPLVVGFNPKDIRFTPDGTLALVIADASMAAIELTGSAPEPTFIRIADPLSPPAAEEVEVTADGRYAFVRQFGTDAITVVDLDTRVVSQVAVGANPTDLDLTPDGTGAVVVSRGAKEITVLSTDDPFATPRVIPFPDETPFGSVVLGIGHTAVLYTNATLEDRYAVWDLQTDAITLHPLAKPAQSIARTPTGDSLLVVHTREDNPDGSTPEPYQGRYALSLIDLDDHRANTISLSSKIKGFSNSGDGDSGYVILEGAPYLEVLDYRTLIYEQIELKSDAVFVGVLPDLDTSDADEAPAWVSQEHVLGRMSFYDPDDGALQTITGFELNGSIEE